MNKITGIKSVDFKITALGHGVVNWNGPTNLSNEGKTVDNHTLPKLRGYTNLTGRVKEETGYKYKKEATDIDFKKTPLYISQNCIRHHLFRDQAFDLHFAKEKDLTPVIASITGLMRGFVVPSSQCKRTSPMLIEDFVDELGNGNFDQFGQAGERDSSSFFSKTTFGDTKYTSYGSISLEQLQFISLDNKFDRAAMIIKEGQGEEVAQQVQDFIQSLNSDLDPKAVFHANYVRGGTIFEEGEQGILLNQDAMQILVDETIDMLKNLTIRQAKGYMYVDEMEMKIDYNDSNKMMRFKNTKADGVNPSKDEDFAVYFYAKDK
ncbi:FIG01202690: hypothetical protein [uncultured Candidatus Thioglobus sp.]|nr:FIG01202690: hypothetical protein [uncultured Candidatus Thioglobus sp.]